MATRATIGYYTPDNTITTTYNHYDGYPESLGVAVKTHNTTDEKAKEVANMDMERCCKKNQWMN